jgi:tRNA(Ile2)-agmatinylcytidine synthase
MTKVLHIGFDDTDSLKGSCTTHLAALVIHEIFDQVTFRDFPNLIRLNPNIPYKTRGNGAVALRVEGYQSDLEFCKEVVLEKVKSLSEIEDENTNPGVVFVEGGVPKEITKHSIRAMWDVITIAEAEKFNALPNVAIFKFNPSHCILIE